MTVEDQIKVEEEIIKNANDKIKELKLYAILKRFIPKAVYFNATTLCYYVPIRMFNAEEEKISGIVISRSGRYNDINIRYEIFDIHYLHHLVCEDFLAMFSDKIEKFAQNIEEGKSLENT